MEVGGDGVEEVAVEVVVEDGGEVALEEVAVEGGVAVEAVGGEVEVAVEAVVEDGVKEVAV